MVIALRGNCEGWSLDQPCTSTTSPDPDLTIEESAIIYIHTIHILSVVWELGLELMSTEL